MSHREHQAGDPHFPKWVENSTPLDGNIEIVQLSAVRTRATDEAGAAIARQLNGPLTALLLYMNEIKQHSHQLSQPPGNRVYLQQVVENALQQTERVCAMMKQIAGTDEATVTAPGRNGGRETRAGKDVTRTPGVMF